jgi:hypothetical protein
MKQSIHSTSINPDDDGFLCYSNELFFTKTFEFTHPQNDEIVVEVRTNNGVVVQGMDVMMEKANRFVREKNDVINRNNHIPPPDQNQAVKKLNELFGLNTDDLERENKRKIELQNKVTQLQNAINDLKIRLLPWTYQTVTPDPNINTPTEISFYNHYADQIFKLEQEKSLYPAIPNQTPQQIDDEFNALLNKRFKLFAGTENWSKKLDYVTLLRCVISKNDLRFDFEGKGTKWGIDATVQAEYYDDETTRILKEMHNYYFFFNVYYPILKFRLVLILEIQ